VVTAESGAAALSQLVARGRAPDLVIADYRLGPRRTGTAAIASIRKRLANDKVPGIVLTGDMVSPRLRHLDFPLLHKPVRPDDLRAALRHAFRTATVEVV
jgi:CheY-like chemotaxis protein